MFKQIACVLTVHKLYLRPIRMLQLSHMIMHVNCLVHKINVKCLRLHNALALYCALYFYYDFICIKLPSI